MSLRNLYLIGHCLSLDEHPRFRETIIAEFIDSDYDWDDFIWTCSNHLVLPLIYLKFKAYNLLNELPEVLKKHLEEIYKLNRNRNEQILSQMKQIIATLNGAGISPIFMKGTANLIDGIYGDIGERIIGDIDFLVPDEDFLTTAELLKNEGYIICFPAYMPYNKMKHYPRLWKEDVPADIEIHRLPSKEKHTEFLSYDHVQRSMYTVADYPGCFVMTDSQKAIHSFIHSQMDNAGHRLGVVSLRDIYDLYCFSKRVDIDSLSLETQYKQKFIAYLTITQKLLWLPMADKHTLATNFFLWKHDKNHTSPLFHSINRITWLIPVFLSIVIPIKIKEFIYYKEARQILLQKMGSKNWYFHQIEVYKKMITG